MKREEIRNHRLELALTETEEHIMLSRARRRVLLRRAEQIEALAELFPETTPIISLTGEWITVHFWITVPGFTSEACPMLAEQLEQLSEMLGVDPSSEDAPNDGRRYYNFDLTESGPIQKFRVCVWTILDSASEACQRIITGTRKQTQVAYVDVDVPTYAFKC